MDNDFEKLSLFLCSYSPIFEKIKNTIKKSFKSFISYEYVSETIKLLKA